MNAIETFKTWLYSNASRFRYKLIIIEEKHDQIFLQFEEFIPNIKCFVTVHFIDIWYEHTEEKADLLFEIDMPSIKISTNGLFYCDQCSEPEYFKDRDELYGKHSFYLLLEWVNNINAGDTIRISDSSEYGIFSAELHQKKESRICKDMKSEFIDILKEHI